MFAFGLFVAIVVFGALAWFFQSRQATPDRHWANQTALEKLLLAVPLASVFQFLFFLPGWAVAATIVGYKDTKATAFDEFLFGIVALAANALIYTPVFFLLLSLLFWISKERESLD